MAKLEAKLGMIIDSVGNLFSGKDSLPLYDSVIVAVRIARIFNTYGPRMLLDDGRVVSNFVAQETTELTDLSRRRKPDQIGRLFENVSLSLQENRTRGMISTRR